jgi:hypothetical protein
VFQVARVVRVLPVWPRPNQIDRTVHGNPVEPRAEVRTRLEPSELLVSLEKRFLHDIFCVLRVAGHSMREPVDSAPVALHERTESLTISVAGQRDGGGVRLRHPIG